MDTEKLDNLSIADLWAVRETLRSKIKGLQLVGDKYQDEIKELVVDISEVSDVLNAKIDELRLK